MPETTVPTDPVAGKATGTESSLSNWAGPYVTDMLGKGKAAAEMPYQGYQGPLTAGTSGLQNTAFQGIGNLAVPTGAMGAFDATAAQNYMNPYLQSALQPQLAEMRRQSQISGLADTSRLTKAGAYGGTRQAVMDAERDRSLQANIGKAAGEGYARAFDQAGNLFNKDRGFGLQALAAQQAAGREERGIEQEGIAADRAAFEEERDYPYKQAQYMQSLLQGLPIEAKSVNYAQSSDLSKILSESGGVLSFLKMLGFDVGGDAAGGGGGTKTVGDTTFTDPETGITYVNGLPQVNPVGVI